MESSSRSAASPLSALAALVPLFLFASCAATVKVTSHSPAMMKEAIRQADLLHDTAASAAVSTFAEEAGQRLEKAKRCELARPAEAAGSYLKTAVEAYRLLSEQKAHKGSETERALVEIHNRALSRFVELWMKDPRQARGETASFACEGEMFEARLSPDSPYASGYFDRAVSSLSLHEKKGIQPKVRDGYGAPLVGIREHRPEREEEMRFYPLKGLHVPATLTIDGVSRTDQSGTIRVALSLRDPLQEEVVSVGSRRFPLAADYSAPIAVILNHQSEAALGLEDFFKAEQRAHTSGIFLTEPYDPDRIPVLLIHGLISVPMIWRDMIPELMSEPDLSKRYQFMVFRYPSGYPIAESAELLRDSLAELRAHYDPEGNDPLSNNLVVAGHSMGGILTHTLVVEMGDHLWKQINPTTPLEDLNLPPAREEQLRDAFYFDPDPAVWRAIYFSAPHRGAKMADKSIAGLVSRAAKLPSNVLSLTQELIDPRVLTNPEVRALSKGTFTSAQSLRPGAPMVMALDEAPYRSGVKYHSIMGDRGKGDTPNSSDGVVEYWSSHQDGAESELIVPTDHGSYKSPLAIAEMKRILRLHAALR